MFEMFFMLIAGHALADFALQVDTMAKGKNRNRPVDMSVVPPGQTYTPTWAYWLGSHALIHGLVVSLITGIWWLGLAETVLHFVIDFAKCENWTGIHADQALHVFCKVAWVLV